MFDKLDREEELGMLYYPNNEYVPMKFHYFIFGLFVPVRTLANIGGLPTAIELEQTLHGTDYEWYGKFAFISIIALIIIGAYTEYVLIKRKRNAHIPLMAMLALEAIVKIIADYVNIMAGADILIESTAVMVILYLAMMIICFFYYEKRKNLFTGSLK